MGRMDQPASSLDGPGPPHVQIAQHLRKASLAQERLCEAGHLRGEGDEPCTAHHGVIPVCENMIGTDIEGIRVYQAPVGRPKLGSAALVIEHPPAERPEGLEPGRDCGRLCPGGL